MSSEAPTTPPTCDGVPASLVVIETRPLEIEGLLELRSKRWADDRGFFSEVWRDEWLGGVGLRSPFVQQNHSHSSKRGVLRRLHLQSPPAAQDKLIRVSRGS